MTKGVKAFGYLKMIPSALLTLIKLKRVFVYAKVKMRRSENYFLEGLKESGMDDASAREIVKECFDEEE